MTRKLTIGLGLSASALLLAGCSGVSVDQIEESTNELNDSFQTIISTQEQLVELESTMNEDFETVLAEDEELTSLQDESAAVIQNIDQRAELVNEGNAQINRLNEEAEFIRTYEGEDLPADTVHQISEEFIEFSGYINNYFTDYQESLDIQKDYLLQIADEEADYEDFSNGINEVNSNYMELQDVTLELDNTLVSYDENLKQLEEMIAETREDTAMLPSVKASETEDAAGEEEDAEESDSDEQTEEAVVTSENVEETAFLTVSTEPILNIPDKFPLKFVYDSGVDITYPEEGVKGIYVTAHSAGGAKMDELVDLLGRTDLNSMVIDIKDDYGNITADLNSDNELVNEMTMEMFDVEEVMSRLDENDIYPIARIVVFKDTLLANAQPELSFTRSDGSVWTNNNGDGFVNPYMKEVWDYNIEVAIQAAKLGFKEIQFDYVRFAEGFELLDRELNYGHGHYGSDDLDVISMEYRNQAVTDFVAYAKEQLKPYGVDVSVDIFGYAAVVRETPGIGQSFPGIAKEVDVISSMIYPSHWGLGNLDIAIPDLEPYNLVNNYAKVELELLDELGEDAPTTRPWIQDFTASYLGAGYYMNYGPAEVTAQVKALADNGINEFLLWNAGNSYSEGATYTFE